MEKTLRLDLTTSEHGPFGRAIGIAMYKNPALFEVVDARYEPHTGMQHRFIVRMSLLGLHCYLAIVEETIGKFAEITFARTIIDHMISKQTPVYSNDRLHIARIRQTLREVVGDVEDSRDITSAVIQSVLEHLLSISQIDPLSLDQLNYVKVQLVEHPLHAN